MKRNLSISALLGCLTIILGAFGAHALKDKLDISEIQSYETAVRYMMYHVITLLFINTYSGFDSKTKNIISYLFFIGILFFSGSIFMLTIGQVQAKYIWFITPIGGFIFIIGWLKMALSFLKIKPDELH